MWKREGSKAAALKNATQNTDQLLRGEYNTGLSTRFHKNEPYAEKKKIKVYVSRIS